MLFKIPFGMQYSEDYYLIIPLNIMYPVRKLIHWGNPDSSIPYLE